MRQAKNVSNIAQGLAAIAFLYTFFFPRAADPSAPRDTAFAWTPLTFAVIALGVSVLSGVVLNLVSLRQSNERTAANKAQQGGTTLESWSAPYHGDNTGLRLESAMFGAPGIQPENVTQKVKSWLEKGNRSVPVSWQLPLDGRDSKPHSYKYLTATFSVTEMEGKELMVPAGYPWLAQKETGRAVAQAEQLAGAPHLVVHYRGGLRQILTFTNDGKSTIARLSTAVIAFTGQVAAARVASAALAKSVVSGRPGEIPAADSAAYG